ncbi:GNAT family N-acetyltransferase [Natronospora cellulosivora (SeqCode)]
MVNLKYKIIDNSEYNKIKPLWQKLNKHHQEKSGHFKSHFANNTFEKRMKKMLANDDLIWRIEVVEDIDRGDLIAYCIISINDEEAEIDSLYIDKEYRRLKIGDKLMKSSLEWIKEKGTSKTMIVVSWGNRDALDFYRKYGFEPRSIKLYNK